MLLTETCSVFYLCVLQTPRTTSRPYGSPTVSNEFIIHADRHCFNPDFGGAFIHWFCCTFGKKEHAHPHSTLTHAQMQNSRLVIWRKWVSSTGENTIFYLQRKNHFTCHVGGNGFSSHNIWMHSLERSIKKKNHLKNHLSSQLEWIGSFFFLFYSSPITFSNTIARLNSPILPRLYWFSAEVFLELTVSLEWMISRSCWLA